MSIVASALSFVFLILSIIIRKTKSIKPSTVFFAVWTFVLLLSSLNLYNIDKPSDEAYLLIILMLVFFFCGSVIGSLLKIKIPNVFTKYKKDKKILYVKPRYIIFFTLSFFKILFSLIDCIIIFREYSNGTPMWQIRNWGLQPFGTENPILSRRSFIEEAFRSIILVPFSDIVPPITAYMFFYSNNKKEKYALLANSLIILILSSISGGGGRIGFIYYIGCFLLAFFIFCRDKNTTKKAIKKYIKIMLIFIIIGIIFVLGYTVIRNGIGTFAKEIYTYIALPPTLLSEWLPELEESTHTYGFLTTFGIHSYFFRALQFLGLDWLVPQLYNDAYQHILNAETFKNVGYGIANAFVTPIYYFFIDGGYPFVCIASFIFGYLVIDIHTKIEKNLNLRSFTFYALMIYGIFLSFTRVQTVVPSYIISFIFAWTMLKTAREKKEDKQNE